MSIQYHDIDDALQALRQGQMVILMDDTDRENEGDLILPAANATAEQINFMAQHARGLICLSLSAQDFERLQIPMMTDNNTTPNQTAFGVSFEAREGISTGISAHDRAKSVHAAINPAHGPQDIRHPGHLFPLKCAEGGVLTRRGHTEGACDLARLADFSPSAVICEIMNPDGTMARADDLKRFADQHQLCLIRMQDLIDHRWRTETLVTASATTQLPIATCQQMQLTVYNTPFDSQEHVAIFKPSTNTIPLVRIHSECLTGDIFGSERCDCGAQLDAAISQISRDGGTLIYLRQEGRGIGLANKIKAYALQDQGMDTAEANVTLGHPVDNRDYAVAAQILKAQNIHRVRLMTNNPEKIKQLTHFGIEVCQRIPLELPSNPNNHAYLSCKKNKMGHLLTLETA